MPPTTAKVHQPRNDVSPHVDRFVTFTEPSPADDCLGLACDDGPLPAVLRPLVGQLTSVGAVGGDAGPASPGAGANGRTPTVLFSRDRLRGGSPDATALPYRDGAFTLVVSYFSMQHLGDPAQALREMVRVCRPDGRVIIAELVRPSYHARERDRLERLRNPAHRGLPALDRLVHLLTEAGAHVRRLERINVERPLECWLQAADPQCADAIRQALLEEVDGGPRTGARPRIIGGEIWVTQTWAHLAAEVCDR